MNRRTVPLSERRGDIAILAFFLVNILFITYVVDVEQLIIPNPAHFTYPIWPPKPAVDAVHWWGQTFDPVLMARPGMVEDDDLDRRTVLRPVLYRRHLCLRPGAGMDPHPEHHLRVRR